MLNLAGVSKYTTYACGSCDCLVLVIGGQKIFVLNPLTREIREVARAFAEKRPVVYGFGYDSLNDDYKIVAFSYNLSRSGYKRLFVKVYSLKNSFWKRVKSHPRDHVIGHGSSAFFINGRVNWLVINGINGNLSIAAFDLADETFHAVPLPIPTNTDNFRFGHLGLLGGCLCVCGDCRNELWMMKECGVHESWIKFKIVFSMYWIKLVCMLGEEVVMQYDKKLVIYNMTQGTMIYVVVNEVEDCNHHVAEMTNYLAEISYLESLVSPYVTNENE